MTIPTRYLDCGRPVVITELVRYATCAFKYFSVTRNIIDWAVQTGLALLAEHTVAENTSMVDPGQRYPVSTGNEPRTCCSRRIPPIFAVHSFQRIIHWLFDYISIVSIVHFELPVGLTIEHVGLAMFERHLSIRSIQACAISSMVYWGKAATVLVYWKSHWQCQENSINSQHCLRRYEMKVYTAIFTYWCLWWSSGSLPWVLCT
jgi:hypothetical protein